MSLKKVVVIGSGIAGIAAAIRLACKGYSVAVYEANAAAGGKLSAFTDKGFRFDAGPSLFTMPAYVDDLFYLAGENPRDYFTYRKLNINCHYVFSSGKTLDAVSDRKQFAHLMAEILGENPAAIQRYLQHSETLYNITAPVFLESSLHRLSTYLSRRTLYGMANLWRLRMFRSMNADNERQFRNPETVQFFNRFATYNGSDPYQAPATLNVIPHLEFGIGAYFPAGGMYSITESLASLATRCGVTFHYNNRVQRIVVKNRKSRGIITATGEYVPADIVISNMDVTHAYRQLLPDIPIPARLQSQESSSSALIFYWGIKKTFTELQLHNIFFSSDYRHEFDCLFNKGTVADDPTIYINISSKCEAADAPAGMENWFVMVNAPANTGQDWDKIINSTRDAIVRKLSTAVNCDLQSLIISETVRDPRSIELLTSSYRGALYGSSSNNRLAAFFRHPNMTPRIKNLYFCGGSVHPGGGIPLCLLSAKITADMIKPASA